MAKCECGGEYSVLDNKCFRCGKKKGVGTKVVDTANEVGDLFGL